MINKFERNKHGRDYIIGDIHGHFTRVMNVLQKIQFNFEKDRLFSVGDLVDRGPESRHALDWLAAPWFKAVRGNHEAMAIAYFETRMQFDLLRNGGKWFLELPIDKQALYVEAFCKMPYAIELETLRGTVGIVHADCPQDWYRMNEILRTEHGRDLCLWSRTRIQQGDDHGVRGVRAVVVGHTPLREPRVLGNVLHIDTAGWAGVEGGVHRYTVLDAESLEAVKYDL